MVKAAAGFFVFLFFLRQKRACSPQRKKLFSCQYWSKVQFFRNNSAKASSPDSTEPSNRNILPNWMNVLIILIFFLKNVIIKVTSLCFMKWGQTGIDCLWGFCSFHIVLWMQWNLKIMRVEGTWRGDRWALTPAHRYPPAWTSSFSIICLECRLSGPTSDLMN